MWIYPCLEGCLEFGASVIVASSSQSRVDDAKVRLTESGDASRISGYTIDLRGGTEGIPGIESRMYKFLVEQVKEPFDHFVFTAGDKMHLATIAEVDLVKVNENQDVRYWAPYAAIKIIQKHFLLKEGGSITLTGGVNDIRPHPGWAGTTSGTFISTMISLSQCNELSWTSGLVHTCKISVRGNGTNPMQRRRPWSCEDRVMGTPSWIDRGLQGHREEDDYQTYSGTT